MAGVSVTVTFDARQLKHDINELLDEKVRAVRSDKELYHNILEKVAKYSEPYVPKDKGQLRASATITDRGLRYSATNPKDGYNYAGIQYDNESYRHRPPETHHWVDVALAENWDDFVLDVAEMVSERMNNE